MERAEERNHEKERELKRVMISSLKFLTNCRYEELKTMLTVKFEKISAIAI